MRVRIIRKPPTAYGSETGPLLVGRIYNVGAALASALMVEGYAEHYDTLTPDEKRERASQSSQLGWMPDECTPTWPIVSGKPKP